MATPGWINSTRRARLPPDWPQRRAAVYARDGGRCQWPIPGHGRCLAPATDCDHIVRGDDHALTNLWMLCTPHHRTKTSAERPPMPTKWRPREAHPAG